MRLLELLYVVDEAEVQSGLVAPLRLWERSQWRHTHASPFGLCLRGPVDAVDPFPTVAYRPPYLRPGMAIPVARETAELEPMLFVQPGGVRPDALPAERRQPLEHPLGVRRVSAVRFVSPGTFSTSVRAVEALGIASFERGDEHLLEIALDGGHRGEMADLRPELPLVLRW